MTQSLAPTGRARRAHLSPDARKKWRTSILAWSLLLPSFLFLGTFTLYPIVSSAVASFYRDNLSTIKPVYVGLKQYAQLFSDPIFMKSFYNNLLVAVVTIPASIGLAVAMAIFAHKVRLGKGFVRVAFFYPTLLPMVAVANIWLFIYTPGYGLLGYINPSWRLLSNPDSAIWALIAMLIWKQAGYVMIFYISGLQNINEELYDAASIDGARPLGIFRHITWPLLRPTTLYVSIIALTNAYKLVDHLYIMTKGGPNNATNMLLFYIFQVGFDFWDVGRASAMTVVLVGLLLLVSAVQFFTQDKRTFYS